MGAGKYDNKHGVGMLLNKSGNKELLTQNTSTNVADHHIEKMYMTIEKHTENCKRYIPLIGGEFNAELGRGHGNECISVGRYALNEGNRRGDWMKHWMMLQGYTALNTMYRTTLQKQTTFISPKGKDKQIDYILTKRRYLRHAKDAEANDMIHMGSDHRCVMAIFKITMPGKNIHIKNTRKQDTTEYDVRDKAEKKH